MLVTPRWIRFAFAVFGLTSITIGAVSLAESDTTYGVIQLAIGVGWLLVGAFKERRPSEVDDIPVAGD